MRSAGWRGLAILQSFSSNCFFTSGDRLEYPLKRDPNERHCLGCTDRSRILNCRGPYRQGDSPWQATRISLYSRESASNAGLYRNARSPCPMAAYFTERDSSCSCRIQFPLNPRRPSHPRGYTSNSALDGDLGIARCLLVELRSGSSRKPFGRLTI